MHKFAQIVLIGPDWMRVFGLGSIRSEAWLRSSFGFAVNCVGSGQSDLETVLAHSCYILCPHFMYISLSFLLLWSSALEAVIKTVGLSYALSYL